MCNRYRMSASDRDLAERYGAPLLDEDLTLPGGELFPKRPAWVVRQSAGERKLDVMKWGFPLEVSGPRGGTTKAVTNVRNYTSQFWRSALKDPERRCLVPVTAFSEYGPGPKGGKPLYWFDLPSRPIFSFAGVWRPAEDGAVFAFLTTEANSVVEPIHPKAMPVILHDEDEEKWLTAQMEDALDLAEPFPAQLMNVAQDPNKGKPASE
ncbi:SOS response-associated peptidase [Croceicoccus hydrothermalis]|jgi:putative SOS response-associated peptidase YedK|uniref:SOS response-associated peptidase n=1 Tax=Croceicoccus hydrothermalis TaxID=2867964 RepID=UPI0023BACB07|nr:SOS response-associated peptidase family protein [Croceicoccus hydrothermalis]